MYKKMYIILFNAITDALQENTINKMKDILKKAQVLSCKTVFFILIINKFYYSIPPKCSSTALKYSSGDV